MTVQTPPTHHRNSMSAISQLCCYWSDFDETLNVGSWEHLKLDSNCHSDICPGNICPGDICPYQEYLSWYPLKFDQALQADSKKLDFIFLEPDSFTQNFCTHNLLDSKLDLSFFKPKYLEQNFLGPTFYFTQIFSDPTPILTWIAFWSKSFLA